MKRPFYLGTSLLSLATILLVTQRGMGPFFILLLGPFLLYVLYQCIRIVRRPAERKTRSVLLGIWLVVFIVGGLIHGYQSAASRKAAETAVGKVAAYRARTGRYPEHLGEVGLSADQLKEKWSVQYSMKEGVPTLSCPSHFMPMSMYEYDFKARTWRVNTY